MGHRSYTNKLHAIITFVHIWVGCKKIQISYRSPRGSLQAKLCTWVCIYFYFVRALLTSPLRNTLQH